MLPKYHIVIGAIAALTIFSIFPITPLQASIIFLSSFLIDVDHYLLYILKNKSLSLIKAKRYFTERRERWINLPVSKRKDHVRFIFIFHGIEFWIMLTILANYFNLIWFVLIGISIHMVLDYIDLIYLKEPIYSKLSQVFLHLKNKGKTHFY